MDTTIAHDIIERHRDREGPLLPILHDFHGEFGCIDQAAVTLIADALNLSQADVRGVVSFYHDFHEAPAGRRVLKVCRAESCQAMGGEALVAYLQEKGGVTIEPVYCLGNCACSPAAMLDGRLLGRLTPAKLDEVLS